MGLLVSDYVVVYTSRLIHSSRPVNSNAFPSLFFEKIFRVPVDVRNYFVFFCFLKLKI